MLLVDPLKRLWVGANNLFDTNPPAVSLYTAPDPERQPRAKRQLRELLEWVPQHWAVTLKIQIEAGGWEPISGRALPTSGWHYLGISQPHFVQYQQSGLKVLRAIAPTYRDQTNAGEDASVAAVSARCRYPDLLRIYVASGTIQAAADALGLSHSTAQGRLASLRGDEPMVSALRSVRTYRRS